MSTILGSIMITDDRSLITLPAIVKIIKLKGESLAMSNRVQRNIQINAPCIVDKAFWDYL